MKEWLINKLFKFSSDPVKFLDLVEANTLFNEGMMIDPAKLHFCFKQFNLLMIYFILCLIVLVPFLAITHWAFEKVDFHISIISSVFLTAAVFVCFDLFKVYARKLASARVIQQSWALHLAYFEYDKYSKVLEGIYKQSQLDNVPRAKLEQYILERLVERS